MEKPFPPNADGEPVARRAIRKHVAFAWIIVSQIVVFTFAYAINLP